jgi:hypothetical protein
METALGEGLTFEKIWAAMQETDRMIKETGLQIKETNQQIKETDRQMKETDRQMKETYQQMKETDKRVGGITSRFGEIVEYMVVPNLVAKFREMEFEFTRVSQDVEIADREHDIFAEIDAFLENGDKVMIVEIKSKPHTDDINDHIRRMEKLRAYADLRNDKRKYLGAVAGVIFGEKVRDYTLKNGFYVVEPSGETFRITKPEGKYQPREW